jgi:hypothetical protein
MRYKHPIFMVAGGILTAPALVTSVIHSGDGPTCSTHEMCSLPPAPSGDEPARDDPHAPPVRSLVAAASSTSSLAGSSFIFRTGYTLT